MIARLRGLWASTRVRIVLVVYAALLVLSHIWTDALAPAPPVDPDVALIEIPEVDDEGPTGAGTTTIGVRGWTPVFDDTHTLPGTSSLSVRPWTTDDAFERPPLLLLHGSPSGGSDDFRRLGPELARWTRRTVLAIDRPGYASSDKWVPSYALRANAHAALGVLESLGVERAHALGWSQGSGAAIWMGAFDPDRVASVTLLAGVGVQSGEGSGDYHFEHAKYALGFVFVVALPEVVPHFGLLGPRSTRHAFIRDFWDTDQRPIRDVLMSYRTPTLVAHGRDDPLVPDSTALEHARITPDARLLMLDASHFFVFREDDDARSLRAQLGHELARLADRHDEAGVEPIARTSDFAVLTRADDRTIGGFELPQTHWLVIVLVIAGLTLISEDLTVIGAGLLVSTQQIDIGVAFLGCYLGILVGDWGLVLIGRFFGRRVLRWRFFRRAIPERSLKRWEKMFDRHLAKAVFLSRMLPGTRLAMYVSAGILSRRLPEFMFWMTVAIALWIPVLMVLAIFVGRPVLDFFNEYFHGPVAVALSFGVLFLLIRIATYEATYSGRHKLQADLRRLVSHEFWPAPVFYLPLVPVLAWLALTRRGPMTFTCADPGIQPAGGVVNEPKTEIVQALEASAADMQRPGLVLAGRRLPAHDNADERTRNAIAIIAGDPAIGGFPVVLKPEAAQRGFGIRVARGEGDVRAYLERMTRDVQIQRYHPGPVEAGVFWSRVPERGTRVDGWRGEIFSVTRKSFPSVTGDGEHTLEHLIWAHPRARMQAGVFLRRFEERLDDVLEEGETLALTATGNHAQGCAFSDGADLITPELARTIDALAQGYRHAETDARIDFGRFDVRAASEDDLRAGRFAVVELNGVLSESTNMYDPRRSAPWAYRVLFRQWARLYDIGRARRAEGVAPTGVLGILGLARGYYRSLPGDVRSD
ncbi:MAG: alpha/beta fold hydrolase [Planctomycetota bacterium]